MNDESSRPALDPGVSLPYLDPDSVSPITYDAMICVANAVAKLISKSDDERLARVIYNHVSGGCDPDAEGWQNYSIDGDGAYGEPQGKQAYLSLARVVRLALEKI